MRLLEKSIRCDRCPAAVREQWPQERTAFRCMHEDAGKFYGRTTLILNNEYVGVIREDPPAWCPRAEPGKE